jgi:hypothetical protein
MMGLRASFVVLLVSGVALAQPPPTDAQKQQAGDLVKKAIAKSQAGDHESAIKLYLDAYAIVPNPILLSNVGSEYQQVKKPVEALKYFCMYLEKDPTGTNASYVTAQAKTLQATLNPKETEICPKPEPPKPVVVEPPPTVTATEKPIEKPAPPPSGGGGGTLRLAGMVVGGAGLATLGAGIFFGIKAKQCSDKLTNHDITMKYTAEELACEDDGPAHEKKQIIFTTAGGVLTAAGVVMYFVGRSKRGTEATVGVGASPAGDGVGVTVTRGF